MTGRSPDASTASLCLFMYNERKKTKLLKKIIYEKHGRCMEGLAYAVDVLGQVKNKMTSPEGPIVSRRG